MRKLKNNIINLLNQYKNSSTSQNILTCRDISSKNSRMFLRELEILKNALKDLKNANKSSTDFQTELLQTLDLLTEKIDKEELKTLKLTKKLVDIDDKLAMENYKKGKLEKQEKKLDKEVENFTKPQIQDVFFMCLITQLKIYFKDGKCKMCEKDDVLEIVLEKRKLEEIREEIWNLI